MCKGYTYISGVYVFILISSKYRMCVCVHVCLYVHVWYVWRPLQNCQEVLKAGSVFEYYSIL